jgi:hypothetical protein
LYPCVEGKILVRRTVKPRRCQAAELNCVEDVEGIDREDQLDAPGKRKLLIPN